MLIFIGYKTLTPKITIYYCHNLLMNLSSSTMKGTTVNNNKCICAYIGLGSLDSGHLCPRGIMAKEAGVCQ